VLLWQLSRVILDYSVCVRVCVSEANKYSQSVSHVDSVTRRVVYWSRAAAPRRDWLQRF